ncbi:MAG TPA: hypothetical protein IAB46_06420 [Candidatus Scybalocola faecigallinarum]|uniref:Uncharacterized protein n=1 Tax=Candidatus Scybalocola faecigallinarum TaxID=2840941 RepID=A0A9D1F3Z6_9FIRM|nr:hypothetical protein [Candidatus Scybalocola faecigallinarum]
MEAVFNLIQMIYNKDKKAIQKKYNGLEIDREVFDVVKSITALDLNTAPDSQRNVDSIKRMAAGKL